MVSSLAVWGLAEQCKPTVSRTYRSKFARCSHALRFALKIKLFALLPRFVVR